MIVRKWMKWNIKVARPMFSINWNEVMKIRWTLFSFSWACYSSVQLGRSGSKIWEYDQNVPKLGKKVCHILKYDKLFKLWPICAFCHKMWQSEQPGIFSPQLRNRMLPFFRRAPTSSSPTWPWAASLAATASASSWASAWEYFGCPKLPARPSIPTTARRRPPQQPSLAKRGSWLTPGLSSQGK